MDNVQLHDFYKNVTQERNSSVSPTVIHISGSPGSGKTTLVTMLQKQIPMLEVIDTDEILQDADPLVIYMRTLPQNSADYVVAWKKAVRTNIERAMDMASQHGKKVIVFAGILSNMNGPMGGIVDISELVHYKYFLNPPLPLLLRRFYGRYETLKEDKEFWKDVADDTEVIPSSKQYKIIHEGEREWHVSRGYKVMESQEDIILTIQKITSGHHHCYSDIFKN